MKLGNTGVDVSRLCIGCMSFDVSERWHHPWVLDEERSRPIIKRALELGINFFDTAKSKLLLMEMKLITQFIMS
ncbi:hypothetical protein ASG81_19940 [Paenibacillus sp. Soil522]|nr:hypothetical protein ASG81_19940 [Paenibacillus sp. Soil522]